VLGRDWNGRGEHVYITISRFLCFDGAVVSAEEVGARGEVTQADLNHHTSERERICDS